MSSVNYMAVIPTYKVTFSPPSGEESIALCVSKSDVESFVHVLLFNNVKWWRVELEPGQKEPTP